jgi:NAD(P)-dependent dehydrogenase (short-subunit alcohol dehydrogenase family)
VNLVREAVAHVRQPGSITLTSGALSHTPLPSSSAVALVNGAVDSFVCAATLDLPIGIRLNVVSPGWLEETRRALGLDPAGSVPAREIAELYLEAIAGDARGQVLSLRADAPAARARGASRPAPARITP